MPGVDHPNAALVTLCFVALAFALSAPASSALALCYNEGASQQQRHPAVTDEFAKSDFVVTVRYVGEERHATADDPEGYVEIVYTLTVVRSYKGGLKPGQRFQVATPNSSARFVIDGAEPYMLFLGRQDDGQLLSVDSCGNSGPISGHQAALAQIKAMKAARRR